MKHVTAILLVATSATLTACGTVPQSREQYIELLQSYDGFGASQRLIYSKEIERPFDAVVADIEDKLNECVPEGYTQTSIRGNLSSSSTVTNNQRIEIVGPDKAEVTVQQHHTGTAMQSEGGLYLLAADVIREGTDKVRLDFYTGKHYTSVTSMSAPMASALAACTASGSFRRREARSLAAFVAI